LADDPKCSGRVNRSRQSTNDVGADKESLRSRPVPAVPPLPVPLLLELPLPTLALGDAPRSSEMSQNGSTVVDTPLKNDKKEKKGERKFVKFLDRSCELSYWHA